MPSYAPRTRLLVASALFAFSVLGNACYASHSIDTDASPPADAALADRFGVWAFASSTGSGLFVVINICEGGVGQVQQGYLGAIVNPRTAGWTERDADRIEVLGLRGGRWNLRWDAGERRWHDEAPIDACAEAGFEPLFDERDSLDGYAAAMACP